MHEANSMQRGFSSTHRARLMRTFLLAAWAAAASPAQGAIPASERQALIDLYDSTNGAGWVYNGNWNGPPGTECTWYGVSCDDGETHVLGINLNLGFSSLSNNLTGSLPASLTGLSHLKLLDVSNNALTGSIPHLSGLTGLQTADFSFNSFSGSLPPLDGLSQLQYFAAASCGLSGAIPTLSGLASLHGFNVFGNALDGPIPPLSDLVSLESFNAGRNALTGEIPSLSGLTQLVTFDVSENQLSGSLPLLDGLANLALFSAANNVLTGAIPSLSGLPALSYFDVSVNQLAGAIPSLDGLGQLNIFSVSDNLLTGPLPSLTGLALLYAFDADWNSLSGSIPPLADLTNLAYFDIDNNRLSGAVPPVPNTLMPPASSSLCPNAFDPTADAGWDAATGSTPWYAACLARPVNLDQFGLTGSWYNPAFASQGILIDSMPDTDASGGSILFAGWFTYSTTLLTTAEGQRWYSLQGNVDAGAPSATLGIYETQGGNFAAPPGATTTPIGLARLTFADCTHGALTYRFNGGEPRSDTIPLQRLTGNTTCGPTGDNGNAASNSLLSGAWYDAAASGQGLIIDISAAQNVLFAGWYTFAPLTATGDPAARQRWYSLQAEHIAPGATTIDNVPIYSTTGGYMNAWTPVTTAPVGTASFSFESCSELTLTYEFSAGENAGLDGTSHLTRLGPAPDGCAF